MKLRFKHAVELDIVEEYCEHTDNVTTVMETFEAGEVVEGDLFDMKTKTIDFQFGDGSCVYGLPRAYFDIIED